MKWVCWYNYARTRGAQGHFHFKGRLYTKLFTGGPKRDLMKKAHAWVLQKKAELGSPLGSLVRFRTGYSRKSNTLPVGVSLSIYDGKYGYAYAYANLKKGKQSFARFSFLKYGKKRAIKLAIAAREEMGRKIKT